MFRLRSLHIPRALRIPSPTRKMTTSSSAAPAAYSNALDFRSDTVTHPTARMLAASTTAPAFHGDDIFHESTTTTTFLARMASLTGTAAAAYVPTATMGNLSSIMSHLRTPPHSLLADSRSHVLNYEAGNIATVAGVFPFGVVPKNGRYMTLEDVQSKFVARDYDVHSPSTTVVVLEVPLDGEVMPLEEYQRITRWVRAQGAKVHVDGARLWHVQASGIAGLKEVCGEADSVQLCFSKGLGAPGGSVVVGTKEAVEGVVRVRKMLGGSGRQVGMLAAMMDAGIDEIFLSGKLEETHRNATEVARVWTEAGGKLQKEVQTSMVWLDLASAGIEEDAFIEFMTSKGIKTIGSRLVFHFQHTPESIEALCAALRALLEQHSTTSSSPLEQKARSYRTNQ